MEISQAKKGQRVKVTVTGEVVDVLSSGTIAVRRDGDDEWNYFAPCVGVTIELSAPANWPPQIGDLWRANGADYYVRKHSNKPNAVVSKAGSPYAFGESFSEVWNGTNSLEHFKALNPELAYRRPALAAA